MAPIPPTTTKKSPFLDTLPPELRLRVYSHLLVAPSPIKGPSARGTTRYNLSTAILRVNRQINAEARSAFFGKNTFYVTSVRGTRSSSSSSKDVEEEEEEGSGAFEPPLQLHDLSLVRHLEIDPLFYPTRLGAGAAGGKTACPAAQRYVLNLTYLLTLVRPSLRSLSFTADARPYARSTSLSSSSEEEEEEEDEDEESVNDALNIPKLLTSFQIIESHTRFLKALADLSSIKHLSVSFLFPESEFHFEVEREELCKRGLLFLACQTVFARSEIGVRALLEGLGEEDEEGDGLGAFDGARRGSVVQEMR
jgi:hypothetical protein